MRLFSTFVLKAYSVCLTKCFLDILFHFLEIDVSCNGAGFYKLFGDLATCSSFWRVPSRPLLYQFSHTAGRQGSVLSFAETS